MVDTETTNTEILDDEEEIVEDEEEELVVETDEEKEQLKKELEELKNKNKSLYEKMKSGYKKHKETKDNYVSKDDVKNILKEVETDRIKEQNLLSKYDDAGELMTEINKIKSEKGLDYEESYALVKGKMMSDEGYRNQINQDRTGNHGNFKQTELTSKIDKIFSKGPKISTPSQDD